MSSCQLANSSFLCSAAPLKTSIVESYDGKHWPLSYFKDKVLVINFFASWCPPCIQELPDLQKLAKQFSGKVQFIGLAVDSPTQEVKALVEQFSLNYPIAQASASLMQMWGASSLPTTYLVNSTGQVVWSHQGAIHPAQLEHQLSLILPME